MSRYISGVVTLVGIAFSLGLFHCSDDDDTVNNATVDTRNGFRVTGLVADTAGFRNARVDPELVNAWGMAPGGLPGAFWVNSNEKGVVAVFDKNGSSLAQPVQIPAMSGSSSNPTGIVINRTETFINPGSGRKANYIYVTEQGTIAAWTVGQTATIVVRRDSVGAVYKGVTLAPDSGKTFLYAADFKNRRIDIFDSTYALAVKPGFTDPTIPSDFAPFNVRYMNSRIFVTYAKQKPPENRDDTAGAGNGYVNMFDTNGVLVKRFASNGTLNSPWGMELTPSSFPVFPNSILIGNFGDGSIDVFDTEGKSLGQLIDTTGKALRIDGLWDLQFQKATGDSLYFSAAPDNEQHGLFGFIQKK